MIVPVFDIKNNECVSGKSGKRDTYTKLSSIYGDNPIEIATNLKKKGAKVLYVADLDKIEDIGDNSRTISLINEIIPVMLDNNISSIEDIRNNKNICTYHILATETMSNLESIYEIFNKANSKNLIISIDIKNNDLLIKNNNINLEDIIQLVNDTKPKYTIILNISQVGTKKHENSKLIDNIIQKTPHTTHFIAGGITNETIKKYNDKNMNHFLIGTILHQGTLEYKL